MPADLIPSFILIVSDPTVGYDVRKPVKRWVDTRAHDPNNTDTDFVYKHYVQGESGIVVRRFVLPREVAGAANVPGPNDALPANSPLGPEVPPETPIPHRDLLPGEYVTISPFQQTTVHSDTDTRPVTSVDLARIEAKLEEILAAVRK